MSVNLNALAQAAETFQYSSSSSSSSSSAAAAAGGGGGEDLADFPPSQTQVSTTTNHSSNSKVSATAYSPSVQKPPEPAVVRSSYLSQKSDWARLLTVEERQCIREKIKEAYKKNIFDYEELVDTCAAMEEEYVYLSASSRLDYFKNGIQYDKKILEKKRQLLTSTTASSISSSREQDVDGGTTKRSRASSSADLAIDNE